MFTYIHMIGCSECILQLARMVCNGIINGIQSNIDDESTQINFSSDNSDKETNMTQQTK